MKLALLGVGTAGTRILNQLIVAEDETGRNFTNGNVVAFNTTPAAFGEETAIPAEREIVIGDTHPAVNQQAVGFSTDTPPVDSEIDHTPESEESSAVGQPTGVDGDPDTGAAVANDELPEIRRALDMIDDTEVDAVMLIAGLGGGTGAGVGSVVLEELQAVYEIPVYVLGALPTNSESDRRAQTAARAVRTMVPMADSMLPIDNEAWHRNAKPLDQQYETINDAIATRIVSLFAAGETDPTVVSEMRIDPADVRRTLAVGGLSSIGYATYELEIESEGWLKKLKRLLGFDVEEDDSISDAVVIKQLVREALNSKLTLPCSIASTDRVLVILSGPPKQISRKGFETGRYLLEEETETVEVLAGDEPARAAEKITATVLFSNVTDVPRIEEIQDRAAACEIEPEPQQTTESHSFEFTGETESDGVESADSESALTDGESQESTTAGENQASATDDDPSKESVEADGQDAEPTAADGDGQNTEPVDKNDH